MLTDYDEYDSKHSQEKNGKKIYHSKKYKGIDYIMHHKQSAHDGGGVYSTKNNPRKNMELKLLFNRTKQGAEQKAKNKGYTAHHPLFKYVSNQSKQSATSPYK
jgi:hypothetical protein